MANLIATDYAGIVKILGPSGSAKIGNNTTATLVPSNVTDAQDIEVRLHGHKIAVLDLRGRVAIRHCGHVTATTFDRLRQLVPAGWKLNYSKGWARATNTVTCLVEDIDADRWLILD